MGNTISLDLEFETQSDKQGESISTISGSHGYYLRHEDLQERMLNFQCC